MSATNRGAVRVVNDRYPTPAWLTEAVVPIVRQRVGPAPSILEPACGDGAIVEVLERAFPLARVRGFDIADGTDFLTEPPRSDYDLIITNPPFSRAREFIDRAKLWRRDERSVVAMLLRVSFLGSQSRAKWLRTDLPSLYVTPRRPCFVRGSSDNCEYAWFLWGPGSPTIGILETELGDANGQGHLPLV